MPTSSFHCSRVFAPTALKSNVRACKFSVGTGAWPSTPSPRPSTRPGTPGVKSDDATRRFNIGPFATAGYPDTLMSTDGPQLEVTNGPSFSAVYDVRNWDESVAQNAPGQSSSPASDHYGDLAKLWAAGEYFPLSFSDQAVEANAESTLTLLPRENQGGSR